ncbi:substrate-binding periplasmic protein [Dongia soli]|uniref:Transporter substrate-binding domain-containing protein n=1 Tax=Dongia soli TaxID=600628 RepID=A0ABU5EBA8_9PROT|nr:transporter substrate-binding domain-containing protein [Dongia soli]MDY0883339.1 transporter substrate-binding domain-containing protein [Dongia soli]
MRNELGCNRPIRVAFYEFGTLYHKGQGIDADIIHEIARRTGCVFEESVVTTSEIWQEIENGELDMTTSGILTPAREKIAMFAPYLAFENMVVMRASLAEDIHEFDDIIRHRDWRLGIVQGFRHGPYYDFHLKAIKDRRRVVAYPDQQSLYNGLVHGQVQLILSPEINLAFYLTDKSALTDFSLLDLSPAPPVIHALVFSRRSFAPAMANAWLRLIEEMRLDGTLQTIYRTRLPQPMSDRLLEF